MVRVGGGFMHINNFIDTFTNGELDKIERHEKSKFCLRAQALLETSS